MIVDYINGYYGYMGLTENPKKGKHQNIPLIKNPQKGNKKPAYLRKKIEYDTEDKFYNEQLSNYNLTKIDKNYFNDYVKIHKKR